MRTYPWLTKHGKRMAVLNAMQGDAEMQQAIVEEPKNLGLSACYNKNDYTAFPCKPFPPLLRGQRPDSVHALTPADIEVVGAIGDSLTSGTGVDACTALGLAIEYRGRVFSIGGDGDVDSNPTLVNMLRRYNPNVIGFSVGKGGYESKNSRFNVAHPGDNSLDVMFQTQLLVQRMREQLTAEQFQQSWKLVTIFIGNNDVCDFCESKFQGKISPALYRQRMQESLDYLHENLPKTFVNLVTLLDTALVSNLNKGLVCTTLHFFTCRCAAFAKDPAAVERFNDEFQSELYDLVDSGRYDNNNNFTVVIQPFFEETNLPTKNDGSIDFSYFAPDCFHFSGKGHAATALALWNSMFEVVGQKKRFWIVGEPFECPDPVNNPYLRTAHN